MKLKKFKNRRLSSIKCQFSKSVDFLLDGLLIKVRTLEDIYGTNLHKTVAIASETITTPEVKQIPLYTNPACFSPSSKYLKGETYTSPEGYTTILEGVLYCPVSNVLLTKDREVISDSLLPNHQFLFGKYGWNSNHLAKNKKPYWRQFSDSKVEEVSGYCSIWRGEYDAYFHTLITEIPRVYLLNQLEYSHFDDIKLLCPEGLNEIESFFLPKLLPSNVNITPVPSDRLFYIEKLIFPSYLNQQSSGYLPAPYLKKFRSEFLPKRPREKKNRIFISRKNYAKRWGKRHILNEEELLKELSKLGFMKYVPEELPISEQIELFYDAEIVVGAHGSGMTNIVFSEGVNILELNPAKATFPYFYYLSKSIEGKIQFWFADNADDPHASRLFTNFRVDVPKVLELISGF